MEAYKREFIQFLEKAGVLRFGDFTAKSGRKIPYFINAGMIKTGEEIATDITRMKGFSCFNQSIACYLYFTQRDIQYR